MLYNNLIAKSVEDLGYNAIFTEGVDRVLGWRSPNYVYSRGPISETDKSLKERIRVLLRNYRLSDDIGYRFSSKTWDQWPLTAEKYSIWASSTPGQIINLFMDFETFGEHHPEETGIFYFLKALPWKVFNWQNLDFTTPSEIVKTYQPVGEVDVHEFNTISWADMERDTSAWLGNSMQQMAFEELKKLEPLVKHNGKKRLLGLWRLLQQSDHLYYMCTKWWGDGDVHKYFSPFSTPHDGFINIISAISEIKVRIAKELGMIEAINMNKKNEKTLKKEFVAIKKLGKKMKKRLTPETTVKFEEEILKPETGLIQTKTNIESILAENVNYPDVKVDFDDIQRASSELRKRVK
jgi:alpha-amylase